MWWSDQGGVNSFNEVYDVYSQGRNAAMDSVIGSVEFTGSGLSLRIPSEACTGHAI